MRADRLVALVLLLRQRGLTTASALAAELEVSPRTVLRDVEALSAAGVPVYAERGRHGGFALLPGFRTELTGLTPDETLALLALTSAPAGLGLGAGLAAAVRKVVDALPPASLDAAEQAAARILVEPETDLLERRTVDDDAAPAVVAAVRRGVLTGRRLRLLYASGSSAGAPGAAATWRLVDPVGLVVSRGHGYLLASASGQDRTYRLSRVAAAQVLEEPAQRAAVVDLAALWRARSAAFRSGPDQLEARLRVAPGRRTQAEGSAVEVLASSPDPARGRDGWVDVHVRYQDPGHACWAVWRLAPEVEVVTPVWLRSWLHDRAAEVAHHNSA